MSEIEKDTPLTQEELLKARSLINEFIKDDKNGYLKKVLGIGSITNATNISTNFRLYGLGVVTGGIATEKTANVLNEFMDFERFLISTNVINKTSDYTIDNLLGRSRKERESVDFATIRNQWHRIGDNVQKFNWHWGNFHNSLLNGVAAVGLTAFGALQNPSLNTAVVNGLIALTAAGIGFGASYGILKKQMPTRVHYNDKIDQARTEKEAYYAQGITSLNELELDDAVDVFKEELKKKEQKEKDLTKEFYSKMKPWIITSGVVAGLCTIGAATVASTIGMGIKAIIATTLSTGAFMAAAHGLVNAHFSMKEDVRGLAKVLRQFKKRFNTTQHGNEKVAVNANTLQCQNLVYQHHAPEESNTDKRAENAQFSSNDTITFRPGISILSGASGAGKSTLVSLLTQSDDIQGGSIQIGTVGTDGKFKGQNYANLEHGAVFPYMAIASQSSNMIEMSVKDYIRLANPKADPKKVQEVKELLGIGDGTNGTIDENRMLLKGAELSGGEKKRLSLAKALIKDTPIMILDEPTSGVDATMAQNIVSHLNRLKDKTIIYITHSASEIRDINAYQAVDLDKYGHDINTTKCYDLTNPDIKEGYINYFSDRKQAETKKKMQEKIQEVLQNSSSPMALATETMPVQQTPQKAPLKQPSFKYDGSSR